MTHKHLNALLRRIGLEDEREWENAWVDLGGEG